MRENVVYKPVVENAPVVPLKGEVANDAGYGKVIPFPQDRSVETVTVDEAFTKPLIAAEAPVSPLKRKDFTEEAIMARKLMGKARPLPDEVETITVDEAFQKPLGVDEEPKPLLTREDFTREAIERTRALQGITPRLKLGSEYPEHVKIERALRVNETDNEKKTEKTFPPIELRDTTPLETRRLTRSDFPDIGNAEMPPLVFKKEEKVASEKKSILKRFLPNFLSRYFSR